MTLLYKVQLFYFARKSKVRRKTSNEKTYEGLPTTFAFYFSNLQISCLQSSLSKTCTPQTIILKEFAARTFTTKVIKWITKLEPANFFTGNHEKKNLKKLCALAMKNDVPKIGSVFQSSFWKNKNSLTLGVVRIKARLKLGLDAKKA